MKMRKIKPSQIIGAVIALVGFLLMSSSIFGIKLDFIPIENGIFSLGLVIIVVGLFVAVKFSEDDEEY